LEMLGGDRFTQEWQISLVAGSQEVRPGHRDDSIFERLLECVADEQAPIRLRSRAAVALSSYPASRTEVARIQSYISSILVDSEGQLNIGGNRELSSIIQGLGGAVWQYAHRIEKCLDVDPIEELIALFEEMVDESGRSQALPDEQLKPYLRYCNLTPYAQGVLLVLTFLPLPRLRASSARLLQQIVGGLDERNIEAGIADLATIAAVVNGVMVPNEAVIASISAMLIGSDSIESQMSVFALLCGPQDLFEKVVNCKRSDQDARDFFLSDVFSTNMGNDVLSILLCVVNRNRNIYGNWLTTYVRDFLSSERAGERKRDLVYYLCDLKLGWVINSIVETLLVLTDDPYPGLQRWAIKALGQVNKENVRYPECLDTVRKYKASSTDFIQGAAYEAELELLARRTLK